MEVIQLEYLEIPPSDNGNSRCIAYIIERIQVFKTIQSALERNRVVALIGPRQCGKTSMVRKFLSPVSSNYFELEDPFSQARLEQLMSTLQNM